MRWLFILLLAFLASCSEFHLQRIPPNQHHADVHSSGSVLSFSPDNRWLVSGGKSGLMNLYGLPGGELLHSWKAHNDQVNGLMFNPAGNIVSASYDGTLRSWNRRGELLAEVPVSPVYTARACDKGRMLSGHRNGEVLLSHGIKLEQVARWKLPGKVKILTCSGERMAAIAGRDLYVWQQGQPVKSGKLRFKPYSLMYSEDGQSLYVGAKNRVGRWDIASGRLTMLDTEHDGNIVGLAWVPEGGMLSISRISDSAVLEISPDNGSTIKRYQTHELCGNYIAVSDNGRFISSTSDDASVMIWDRQNLLPLKRVDKPLRDNN